MPILLFNWSLIRMEKCTPGVCGRRGLDPGCRRGLERRHELCDTGGCGADGGELGEQQRHQPLRGTNDFAAAVGMVLQPL